MFHDFMKVPVGMLAHGQDPEANLRTWEIKLSNQDYCRTVKYYNIFIHSLVEILGLCPHPLVCFCDMRLRRVL